MKIKLKKGLNLAIAGGIEQSGAPMTVPTAEYAIVPDDFPGFTPKLEVKEGDTVKAGEPLLRDKNYEDVKITAPAAGTVKAVVRGERRKIERIVVEAKGNECAEIATAASNRQEAMSLLCRSGILARMRQRPYDIVPRPDRVPRDIFVTAIDSAPLAYPMANMVEGKAAQLGKAVQLLKLVTDGKVYISYDSNWKLGDIAGAEMVEVEGKHPAGNAGVQAANIAPVNKGETIWCLDVVTLCKLGEILASGKVDGSTVVAVTGSEVENPCLVATTEGAQLSAILGGKLKKADHHVRIISGNVLTGTAEGKDGYLRFPYRQVTVIPNGDDVDEFMGWASLSPNKMSTSRSYPGHFLSRLFKPDARIQGGRRAMIMSGEYDSVLPMDIMAEYLLKAINAKDIEAMEKLGIYEVAPEDFALAEYVDTSKLPLQQMVREALDYLRKELE